MIHYNVVDPISVLFFFEVVSLFRLPLFVVLEKSFASIQTN